MAVLSTSNRTRVRNHIMRVIAEDLGITKPDLQAAVDAADNWLDTNAASFNSALPQPARGALTTQQKVQLLCFVAQRRAGLLVTQED